MAQEPPALHSLRAIGRAIVAHEERERHEERTRRPDWSAVRWILEDGTELSTLEYLRECGDRTAPWWRRWIANAAFDDMLEDSVLGSLIAEPPTLDELLPQPGQKLEPTPSPRLGLDVRTALRVTLLLQGVESPETYRTHREHIAAARSSLELYAGGRDRGDDSTLGACEALAEMLAMLEEYAERLEELIEDAGFRYDWSQRRMLIPSGPEGGRPRQLLRDLVRCLVLHLKINKPSEIDRLAAELSPFLEPAALDTSPGAYLHSTLYKVWNEK